MMAAPNPLSSVDKKDTSMTPIGGVNNQDGDPVSSLAEEKIASHIPASHQSLIGRVSQPESKDDAEMVALMESQKGRPAFKAKRRSLPSSTSSSSKSSMHPSPPAKAQSTPGSELDEGVQFKPFAPKVFSSFMNQDPPQLEEAIEYIEQHPPTSNSIDLLEWYYARAQYLRHSRKFDEAIRFLQETMLSTMELMIPNIDIPAEKISFMLLKANAQIELAYCHLENGNVETARTLYEEAQGFFQQNLPRILIREGGLLKGQILLIRILQNKGFNQDALALAVSACDAADQANHRERGPLHELRGDLLFKTGDREGAREAFALAEEIYTKRFGEDSPSRLRVREKS